VGDPAGVRSILYLATGRRARRQALLEGRGAHLDRSVLGASGGGAGFFFAFVLDGIAPEVTIGKAL
jgi:hypothetical protein